MHQYRKLIEAIDFVDLYGPSVSELVCISLLLCQPWGYRTMVRYFDFEHSHLYSSSFIHGVGIPFKVVYYYIMEVHIPFLATSIVDANALKLMKRTIAPYRSALVNTVKCVPKTGST